MQQLILPLSNNSLYHLDEFISSAANQVVYNALKNWQISWGIKPYEFVLLIYGPSSSGKTYLTKIWQNLSNAYKVTNNLDILQKEVLYQNNTFIIENIENWQEESILYCFNLIAEHRKYLLLTTSNLTNNFILQDLSSRINSVLKLEIKQPDDELMQILICKHFSNHSVTISNSVLQFLLANLPRQFEQMIESLEQINYFALIYKRSITISLIKKVLNSHPRQCVKNQ